MWFSLIIYFTFISDLLTVCGFHYLLTLKTHIYHQSLLFPVINEFDNTEWSQYDVLCSLHLNQQISN